MPLLTRSFHFCRANNGTADLEAKRAERLSKKPKKSKKVVASKESDDEADWNEAFEDEMESGDEEEQREARTRGNGIM